MYESIVVPLDGSESAEVGLSYAEELTRRFNSKLAIVGVVYGQHRTFERLFGKYLDDLARRFQGEGLQAKAVLLNGDPAEQILHYATESGGIIVMASHGRSGFTEWGIGGVAEKVLVGATRPVLLVSEKHPLSKAGDQKLERILVPVDGSALGDAALPWAKELAKRTNAMLFLVHAILWSAPVGIMDYAVSFERQLMAKLRQKAREHMDSVVSELEKEGLNFSSDLIDGKPQKVIVDFAKERSVDLIIMSTHGRTGASRLVLGSVTHQVVHATDVPVLVIQAQK